MSMNTRPRVIRNEHGVALVLALFLVTIMSVLAASLMFLSQTETYSTQNYRMMSQARYGAESGVHAAANYLLNDYVASQPGSAGDPITNYDLTKSPVQYNGAAVVLSAGFTGVASNYPVAAVKVAFAAAASGTLAANKTNVSYTTQATLVSMQLSGTNLVQTWNITSDGTVPGARTATVEVSSTLENQIVPGVGYGAFATGDSCGSITMSGSSTTDSYDSTAALVGGQPVVTAGNSNVGTNGNLTDSGNATINGNLYTPRTGVGTCHNGGTGVAGDAQTESGHADLVGSIIQLPQEITMPTPAAPSPLPPTTNVAINSSSTCASIGLTGAPCSGSGGNFTIDVSAGAVSLGNVTLSGGANVTIKGSAAATSTANFIVNSITLSGNSNLIVQSAPSKTYVVMGIAGLDGSGHPLTTVADFTGGSTLNSSFDPSAFQVQYAGTGGITLTGSTGTSMFVDAPNSPVTLTGNGDVYGAIISKTFTDTGNGTLHYDRHLSKTIEATTGQPWLTGFSWKKS